MPTMMTKIFGWTAFCGLVALATMAPVRTWQGQDAKPPDAKATADISVPKEETSTTDHTIQLGGQTILYKATASTTVIKNEADEPTALMYSTAYVRSDVKDAGQRPVAFLYNGGPGSSSVWLHMGAFGPRRVATVDAGPTPPAPYKWQDNTYSLLDKADLVFIDPVGTGFSHAVGKAKNKDFWGVDSDVKSIGQFIVTWINRNHRWNSPKYLIGESYGTFRSAALGNYLQTQESMDLNGIVLISSVLDLGTLSFNPGDDRCYIFYLPSYAATAWYHKVIKDRPEDLEKFLADSRAFAEGEYATALMKGSRLTTSERADIAKKMSRFTGLSEDYLVKADLRVNLAQFMAELQRGRGLTTGRLDSRFAGATYDMLTENAEYDPQSSMISSAFASVFNNYVRGDLNFGQDHGYVILSNEAGGQWDWKHQGQPQFGFPGAPNTEIDLVQALISNPNLRVEVENGYYDMATPFFATEHTMNHLGLREGIRDRIVLKYYAAGHMMYVRDADLAQLSQNIRTFIGGK
jgi:carboxypeptidase C (cathepsin A)